MARAQFALVNRDGDHIRTIARSEGKRLVANDEAVLICRGCNAMNDAIDRKTFCGAHGKLHRLVYVATANYGGKHISNTSITFAEMLANLGLSKRDELNHVASRAYVKAVREKIQAWPFCHDTKAPMVVPRV